MRGGPLRRSSARERHAYGLPLASPPQPIPLTTPNPFRTEPRPHTTTTTMATASPFSSEQVAALQQRLTDSQRELAARDATIAGLQERLVEVRAERDASIAGMRAERDAAIAARLADMQAQRDASIAARDAAFAAPVPRHATVVALSTAPAAATAQRPQLDSSPGLAGTGAPGSARSSGKSHESARVTAARTALLGAFASASLPSRIGMDEIHRPGFRVHRLLTVSALRNDFNHSEVDAFGNIMLVPPTDAAERPKGLSAFAVLSSDPGVLSCAHEFMGLTMRHLGCASFPVADMPAGLALHLDSVKVATPEGVPVIMHASLVVTERIYEGAFFMKMSNWPSRLVCALDARADVAPACDDEDEGDELSVRTSDFEEDEIQADEVGHDDIITGPDQPQQSKTTPRAQAAPPSVGSPDIRYPASCEAEAAACVPVASSAAPSLH